MLGFQIAGTSAVGPVDNLPTVSSQQHFRERWRAGKLRTEVNSRQASRSVVGVWRIPAQC